MHAWRKFIKVQNFAAREGLCVKSLFTRTLRAYRTLITSGKNLSVKQMGRKTTRALFRVSFLSSFRAFSRFIHQFRSFWRNLEQNAHGRVATFDDIRFAIELFSIGRIPEAGSATGKNSNIKIEIFLVLSENG